MWGAPGWKFLKPYLYCGVPLLKISVTWLLFIFMHLIVKRTRYWLSVLGLRRLTICNNMDMLFVSINVQRFVLRLWKKIICENCKLILDMMLNITSVSQALNFLYTMHLRLKRLNCFDIQCSLLVICFKQ